jgi:hypothetical protein
MFEPIKNSSKTLKIPLEKSRKKNMEKHIVKRPWCEGSKA